VECDLEICNRRLVSNRLLTDAIRLQYIGVAVLRSVSESVFTYLARTVY